MNKWLNGWKEIADYCGFSPEYLKREWRKWNLPVKMVGGRRVALPKDLDKWLSERE